MNQYYLGRAVILLAEQDKHTTYHHALLLGPECVDKDYAAQMIDQAYQQAKTTNPEDWSYTDVLNILRNQKFIVLDPLVWWENT